MSRSSSNGSESETSRVQDEAGVGGLARDTAPPARTYSSPTAGGPPTTPSRTHVDEQYNLGDTADRDCRSVRNSPGPTKLVTSPLHTELGGGQPHTRRANVTIGAQRGAKQGHLAARADYYEAAKNSEDGEVRRPKSEERLSEYERVPEEAHSALGATIGAKRGAS